jgi:acyl-CoA thioesterase FadM
LQIIQRYEIFFLNLQHARIIVSKVEVRYKSEILNGSVSYVNTKSGASSNLTFDVKQELRNISVDFLRDLTKDLLL